MSDEITITKEDFRRIGYEVIPHAQYDALMTAARQLIYQHRDYYGKSDGRCEACKAIDALRFTGILPEEK